ncbi:MAG: hypothetical protein MI919_15370 [Holophagales bacterium]|nr:hypothetical protein [Holophagales bacterium]
MDATQLELFKRITLDYFAKLAPDDEPSLEEPYLLFGEPELYDYTSLVHIVGEYDGCLYLTSPVPMLEGLLEINGEPEVNEHTLEDMCRELSNVLAGNASQAFAGNWDISVPISLAPGNASQHPLPDSSFIMPIRWRGSRSLLVVGLQPHNGDA